MGWHKVYPKKLVQKMNNDINNVNSVLSRFKGANAKIWLFSSTLSRLVIRFWIFSEKENRVIEEVFLALLYCEHINGPFYWTDVNVEVESIQKENEYEIKYVVIDKKAGFELIASGGIGIIPNPSNDM